MIKSILEIVRRHKSEDWQVDRQGPFLVDDDTTLRFDVFSIVATIEIINGGQMISDNITCPLLLMGVTYDLFKELSNLDKYLYEHKAEEMKQAQNAMARKIIAKNIG